MEPMKVRYNGYEISIQEEPNEDTTATVSKNDNVVFKSTSPTPLKSISQAVEHVQTEVKQQNKG